VGVTTTAATPRTRDEPRSGAESGGRGTARVRRGASGVRPEPAAGEAAPGAQVDDQLAGRLRVAVTRLNRRLRQEAVTGVSPSQESALATINRLGRPTLGELAQAERVQPPSMTRVVATMEAAGLVTRLPDAADRRVSRVALTRSGRSTLERIRSLKTAYLARRLAPLSPPDRARAATLVSLLEELVEDR
jgi:DNA-binding MarR family transcriptional regulator